LAALSFGADALGFLVGAFSIGAFASPHLFKVAARLPGRGTLLTTALAFCFLLASLASLMGPNGLMLVFVRSADW